MTNDLPPLAAAAPMAHGSELARPSIRHWFGCRARRHGLGFLILLVASGALAVRLPKLSARPLHCDEANQAVRSGILLDTGVYHYSPEEHHGPTLYWLTLPSLWLTGARDFAHSEEYAYRIVPVVFGVGLVLLLVLLADALGREATLFAGLLTAVSPAMVFYSRYYVQETLLVFFTLATIACGWRYVRRPSLGWAAAAGASLGLMHSTKETWIVAGASMGAAACLTAVITGRAAKGKKGRSPCAETARTKGDYPLLPGRLMLAFLVALAAACAVAVVFYSSFGRHGSGPLDSLRAYSTYFRRGTEPSIHTHPWYFYLELLVAYRPARGFFWTEGFIVGLAVVGAVASIVRRLPLSPGERAGVRGSETNADAVPSLSQPALTPFPSPIEWERGDSAFCLFLTFYTLFVTVLYALIPYKTPWCLLTFLHAMILLAGVGAMTLLRRMPGRLLQVAAGGLLLVGIAHLGRECYWLNFRLPADTRNPWVYAHTSTDTLNFAAQVERLAQVADEGHALAVHVITPENYWPLPWYLRRFAAERVGYWQDADGWANDAAKLAPPAVIVLTPDVQSQVDKHLRAEYNQQITFGLRPGVLMRVYVRADLWDRFVTARRTGAS